MPKYSEYVEQIDDLLDAMGADSDISVQDLIGAYLDLSGRCESAAHHVQEEMGY